MDIEPVRDALNSKIAHVAGVGATAPVWVSGVDLSIKVLSVIYLLLLVVNTAQKITEWFGRRRIEERKKIK